MDLKLALALLFAVFVLLQSVSSFRSEFSGTMYVPEDRFLDIDGSDSMTGNLDMNEYNIIKPSLVNGIDLDSPGNAITINSNNSYAIASGSISDNELASNSVTSSGDELDSTVAGNQLTLNSGVLDVKEGSGSDLNADILDGKQLSNIGWKDTAQNQTDINVSDLGAADSNLDMNNRNISNTESINNGPKIENPEFSKGVSSSGTGFKHVRAVKNISSGSTENVNVSLSGSKFPSTSYTANCDVEGTDAELDDITVRGISDRFRNKMEVRVQNSLVSNREVLLHCVAIHG